MGCQESAREGRVRGKICGDLGEGEAKLDEGRGRQDGRGRGGAGWGGVGRDVWDVPGRRVTAQEVVEEAGEPVRRAGLVAAVGGPVAIVEHDRETFPRPSFEAFPRRGHAPTARLGDHVYPHPPLCIGRLRPPRRRVARRCRALCPHPAARRRPLLAAPRRPPTRRPRPLQHRLDGQVHRCSLHRPQAPLYSAGQRDSQVVPHAAHPRCPPGRKHRSCGRKRPARRRARPFPLQHEQCPLI